jgi:predicted nucleic acid-binding protein
MISVDSNVLVYAFKTNHENHAVAKEAMHRLLNQQEQVALTEIVMFEFIAQVTLKLGSAAVPTPTQALAQLENWLSVNFNPTFPITNSRIAGQPISQ